MPLGGLNPLPLRLGDDYTAENHKRVAADLVALTRVRPLVTLYWSEPDGLSVYGPQGWTSADVSISSQSVDITLPAVWEDEFGVTHRTHIVQATAGSLYSVEITAANKISVHIWQQDGTKAPNLLPGEHFVVQLWSAADRREIGDYGGALDKVDSVTEGKVPYAASVLREVESMRGSAYTTDSGSLVRAENLALARHLSWINFRMPEKLAANATPAGSDERLGYWVRLLEVPVYSGDEDWRIRGFALAQYRSPRGASYPQLREALEQLLPNSFVGIDLNVGTDLDHPPFNTYGPHSGGPTAWDLGGGTWSSSRALIGVELSPATGLTVEAIQRDGSRLTQLLDKMLPAWASFQWYSTEGFILDQHRLDINRLG